MAFVLPLQPGGTLDVRATGGEWRLRQGTETLGRLTASAAEGTTIVTTDGALWTVSGSVVPLDLTLWNEQDGAGAAWCQGRKLRRGATVQVAGTDEEVVVHDHVVTDIELTTDDGTLARLTSKHHNGELDLRFELADRVDVARFAPAIALVASWRAAIEMLPRFGSGWVS